MDHSQTQSVKGFVERNYGYMRMCCQARHTPREDHSPCYNRPASAHAGVAELVDAPDSKSGAPKGACRFEPDLRYQEIPATPGVISMPQRTLRVLHSPLGDSFGDNESYPWPKGPNPLSVLLGFACLAARARKVVAISPWPRISETTLTGTPLRRASVAYVCLRSWKCIGSTPAQSRKGLK